MKQKLCACGNPAIKLTSDGRVCERCDRLEQIDIAEYFVCGVRERDDLKPYERDYSEATDALSTC